MKCAEAYLIKDNILIQALSRTTAGIWILQGTVHILQADDFTSIGESIEKSLSESKTRVVHPDYLTKIDQIKIPILVAAKVKTRNMLMKLSKNVSIEMENISINLIPSRFGGLTGDNKGYHGMEDKKITSDLDPENLGRSLVAAFELCE